MIINMEGSCEALCLEMETDSNSLLIQEHKVAGPGLRRRQTATMVEADMDLET